jgi:hypothetical protein
MARAKRKSSRVAPVAAAAEKRNHYGNLEEQICDLLCAADLSATLLEKMLSDNRQNSSSV